MTHFEDADGHRVIVWYSDEGWVFRGYPQYKVCCCDEGWVNDEPTFHDIEEIAFEVD